MNRRLVVVPLAPGVQVVQWLDGAGSPVDDVLVADRDLAEPRWLAVADILVTAAGVAALHAAASRGVRAVRA